MVDIPRGRLLAYVFFAVIVLAVGIWGLFAATDSHEQAEEVVLLGGEPGDPIEGPGSGVDTGPASPAGAASGAGATTTSEPSIFVQVAGAVRLPGVYQLPAGSRVFEAVERAGGALPQGNPEGINLAGILADGARVEVPVEGEDASPVQAGGSSGPGSSGTGTAPGPVSLSHASAAELETLPGVGPKTAERIIAYRESEGPFRTVDDLDLVSGIGPATVERLRDLVVP